MDAAQSYQIEQSPDEILEFILQNIRFGWKTQTRTTQNHATAYCRRKKIRGEHGSDPSRPGIFMIRFNPLSLNEWLENYSPELLELRMIDIIMHEIAHILVHHFSGGWARGHGPEWKLWANLAGFVPFSGTSNHKRNVQAVALHAQHRGGDPTITIPAKADSGWPQKKKLPAPPQKPFNFVPGAPLSFTWKIGQRVEFNHGHRGVSQGMVIRVNSKTISVQVDGEEQGKYWRVSPSILRSIDPTDPPKPPKLPDPPKPRTRPDVIMDLSGRYERDWAKGAKRPADLVRAGILAGLENPEIVKVLRETFPDYRAYKIACSVYRRELKAKGEIA
jgi:predicted SprT family Zn-dependent metalloprotease